MMEPLSRAGFTLVELMIVILILGILAMVALPAFESSSTDSKGAALAGDLAVMRKAIELYYVQHDATYPGWISSSSSWANFEAHMTTSTDKLGNPGTKYGPYLRTGIPRNPFNNLNDGKVGTIPAVADGTTGWYYDPNTGEIRANHGGVVLDKGGVTIKGIKM